MKVILTKDVPAVGKQGDVTVVAEGYARNFLLPRKLAIEASKGNLQNIERQHALEERLLEQRVAVAQAAMDRMKDTTVTLRARSGSGTKLFGSITAQDIADAIKAQLGVDVDKRKIELDKPIRSTGDYDVPVRLHRDVVGVLKVSVVSEE